MNLSRDHYDHSKNNKSPPLLYRSVFGDIPDERSNDIGVNNIIKWPKYLTTCTSGHSPTRSEHSWIEMDEEIDGYDWHPFRTKLH